MPSSVDSRFARRLALGTTLAAAVLHGCFVPVTEGPPSGYEFTVDACTNRFDDDNDGLVDCRDDDCIQRGYCAQRIPNSDTIEPENTAERCSDFIDNDDDGRFDCGDSDCTVILELCCSLEFDDSACSNGIDDDHNGFTDCLDSGCSRNPFVTVCDVERICDDYVDDDGDDTVDCGDSDCASAAHCILGGEDSCRDGDDDEDGRADCDDSDCYLDPYCQGPETTLVRCIDRNDNDQNGTADCTEPTCMALTGADLETFNTYCEGLAGSEDTLAHCSDGVDNDGNNYTDCNDYSCSRSTVQEILDYCAMHVETSLEACSNGLDDDADGFADCNDYSCSQTARGASEEAVAYCAQRLENTTANCIDGVDNDDNGYVDCSDRACCMDGQFSSGVCAAYLDDTVAAYCASRPTESSLADCSDGVDNDGNGFTDCNDYSCSRSTTAEVSVYCATQGERTFSRCTDGVDNDGNGYADCADYSCKSVLEVLVSYGDEGPTATSYYRSPCVESVGADVDAMRVNCQDGRDNDDDGFVDCDDWDCNWNPDTQDLCFYSADIQRPRVCG